jgi:undecaprenyl phosphate-alpha-L-ara4FN deformylase
LRLALRIEVNSLRGAIEGVPRLLRLLDEHQVKGNFLFSLGPDHAAYPIYRVVPAGLLRHLPAPLIGRKAAAVLRQAAASGHEVGLSAYTPMAWRSNAAFRSKQWTRREVQHGIQAFERLIGRKPHFFGAPGWQMNHHLLQFEEEYGFQYACDVRGRSVFLPDLQGIRSSCPQIPTTLPTLDELLCMEDVDETNVHQYLYAECQRVLPSGEVFSLCAEREGIELLPVMERLLVMWKGGQWELQGFGQLIEALGESQLMRHRIGWDIPQHGSRHQAMQSLMIK